MSGFLSKDCDSLLFCWKYNNFKCCKYCNDNLKCKNTCKYVFKAICPRKK